MRVSVVIPLYNKAAYVGRALDSVLSQTFQDFEIVVVDDGSTDAGADLVSRRQDGRIRLIRQRQSGVSEARNRGAGLARTELIAFLDADDEWQPHFLQTVVGLRKRFPDAGIYATAYCFSNASGARSRPKFSAVPASAEGGVIPEYFRAALAGQPICSSSVMIPLRILQEVGGFPVDVRIGEDLDTWFRSALRYRVAWSPMCGAVYHLNETSASRKGLQVGDVPFARSYEEFLKGQVTPPLQDAVARQYIAHYRLYYNFLGTWLAGDMKSARVMLQASKGIPAYRRRWLLLRMLILLPRPLATACLVANAWMHKQRYVGPSLSYVYRR